MSCSHTRIGTSVRKTTNANFECVETKNATTAILQTTRNDLGLDTAPYTLTEDLYTVEVSDSTLIIPNMGNVISLTFPLASNPSVLGKQIQIISESNFVESTSNNIIELFDLNTTNIVMGNTDNYVILQSDGNGWVKIY